MIIDGPESKNEPALKWWHILIIACIGMALNFLGALAKLLSHPNADITLTVATFTLIFSCLLAIIKLTFFRSPNSRLNR